MCSVRQIRRGECLTNTTAQEFYERLQEECEEKAKRLTQELKTTADDLSHCHSPRSQRRSKMFSNVSRKMANHIKSDLEDKIYKQLWNEANTAVFQNLSLNLLSEEESS